MAKPTLRKAIKGASGIDSVLALSDRFGVTPLVAWGAAFVFWNASLIATYIWSNLAWPWLVLLAVFLAGGLIFLAERLLAALAHLASLRGASNIDRPALASEAEKLSGDIFGLVGEYQGPMQAAFMAGDPLCMQKKAEIQGKLIEQYGRRYEAHAWGIINASAPVLGLTRADIWNISHGTRSEFDLIQMAQFLSSIAAQLRHGEGGVKNDFQPTH
jgi:hypothetical protein